MGKHGGDQPAPNLLPFLSSIQLDSISQLPLQLGGLEFFILGCEPEVVRVSHTLAHETLPWAASLLSPVSEPDIRGSGRGF